MLWVLERTVSLVALFSTQISRFNWWKRYQFYVHFCCCLSWPKSISVLQCKLIICNVILLLNCKGELLLFLLLFVTPIVGFLIVLCFVVRYFVSILVLQSSLVALLCLSCWCLIVVWLFLTMSSFCLQFVIVVFPVHTHFLFLVKQQTGYQISYCLEPVY